MKSKFTVRGDHSRVAARMVNYYLKCINPAYGTLKEAGQTDAGEYLEVLNSHSAIYHQKYNLLFPLSNREFISNIIWKRQSEKSVVVSYKPMNTHPKVEEKDAGQWIRGLIHGAYHITQLDDEHTEVEWGMHINFGGRYEVARSHYCISST